MRFILLALFICSVCFTPSFGEETTDSMTTTEFMTTTDSTTPKSLTTDETTTVESTTTVETTTEITTTESTTTTTDAPTTTTVAPPTVPTLNFRVPSNESVPACLRANMSVVFDIQYTAEINNTKKNETVKVILKDLAGYDGECSKSFDTLTIYYKTGWELTFNYTLEAFYKLDSLVFKYIVDEETFPNAEKSELGPKSVTLSNQSLFSANKDKSYKCFAETDINLSNTVKMVITNYQAQPFLSEKSTGFDIAVECSADTTGTSKLVPIIVGSALAILVIMVLVAYIIGRRKHRPGYQTV